MPVIIGFRGPNNWTVQNVAYFSMPNSATAADIKDTVDGLIEKDGLAFVVVASDPRVYTRVSSMAGGTELLEAAKRALKYLDESPKTKPHEGDEHIVHAFLSTAIAKAEGRS